MASDILYLELTRRRTVHKALSRHGRVYHAHDINEALLFIADRDFEYFFVDADTPQAQAFIRHLRHDPQLAPPLAVVLLTDNDDEDCAAWGADTFLTKSRIHKDLPYVFSHLKVEHVKSARILNIHPAPATEDDGPRSPEADGSQQPFGVPCEKYAHDLDPVAGGLESPRPGIGSSQYEISKTRKLRVTAVALLVVALGLWLFAMGPLGGSSARKPDKQSGQKKAKADVLSGDVDKIRPFDSGVRTEEASGPQPAVATGTEPPASSTPVDPNGIETPLPVISESPERQGESPQPEVVETAKPAETPSVNRNPSVSLSGPTRVNTRQTVVYAASASDPDGDSITYSWGGPSTTRCWSTPGLYSVSVTVTDSRGASASASISVRVI